MGSYESATENGFRRAWQLDRSSSSASQRIHEVSQRRSHSILRLEAKLSDNEVAAVATHVRDTWGNAAPDVTVEEVKSLRKSLEATTP
jgi:4-hydroxy-3-methylbut-2-enyl diphosphate reductase IspH